MLLSLVHCFCFPVERCLRGVQAIGGGGVTDGYWGERRSREMSVVGQTALEKVFLIQNGRHDFAVKNFIREAL